MTGVQTCALPIWAQDEHRDGAVESDGVPVEVGPGRDGPLPPDGPFRARRFASLVVLLRRAVLQLDVRFLRQVVVPVRRSRGAAVGGEDRVLAVVLGHQVEDSIEPGMKLGADPTCLCAHVCV